MENGNPSRALHHWRQALSLTQTLLQEVYISLLMYRLYEINRKTELARQELHKILARDPYLDEANYQQVVLLAKEGKEEEVLAKLQKLIQEDWLVYLKVILDPAFAPLRPLLYPFLQHLFQAARSDAIKQLNRVTEELNRLHYWYPPPARIPAEIDRSLESMRRHIKSNSFLGYQEAAYKGQVLQTRLHKLLFQRKESLQSEFLTTLSSLQDQLRNLPSSLYQKERVDRLGRDLSRLRKFGDPNRPQQFWRAWRELQRIKMMVQQLLLPKPPVKGWKERLARSTRLLLQFGLFSLLGGMAVDGLLLSIWGYRMYFSAFRPSAGELLTTLELGAILGLLLGSAVGWIWGRYRVSH